MQNALLKKYATLREKIAELETQESVLKAEILEGMGDEKKVDSDYGTFTKAFRKSWTFSKKVKALEEKIKIQKFTEQEKGIATFTEAPYLVYKTIKNDNE